MIIKYMIVYRKYTRVYTYVETASKISYRTYTCLFSLSLFSCFDIQLQCQ